MAKIQREIHPKIHLDDFHMKNTGYVESFKASWQERGVIATLLLDVVDRDHWQHGHYRQHAYELFSHLNTVSGRPMGAVQEDMAFMCLRELRVKVLAAMSDAGWEEVDTTREGQPIFQYHSAPRLRLVPSQDAASGRDLSELAPGGAGAEALDMTAIQINQAQLHSTGFIRDPNYEGLSFARWERQGVLALAWLEEVSPAQRPQGAFMDMTARTLTFSYDHVPGLNTLALRQEALGHAMIDQFRPYLVSALLAAGWQVIYRTQAGQDIWFPQKYLQHHPELEPLTPNGSEEVIGPEVSESDLPDIALAGAGAEVPGEDQPEPEPRQSHIVEVIGSAEAKGRGQQPAYSREVFTREVTFTCIVCEKTVTQQRYPGHTPLYCSEGCREERVAAKTRERVARHREKKKAEAGNKTSQEPATS